MVARSASGNLDVRFRHSGWRLHRARLLKAFDRIGLPEERRRRFQECGSGCWVVRTIEPQPRFMLRGFYCKDRFCSPCQAARTGKLRRALSPLIKNERLRFITLTLRHAGEDLSPMIDKLLRCFKQLRRTRGWKYAVRGGLAVVEVKRSKNGDRWHPHLHILCTGKYYPHNLLKQSWCGITKGSSVVDIRPVDNPAHAVGYIMKYLKKPNLYRYTNNENLLDETIVALSGRRLIQPFGEWRSCNLNRTADTVEVEPICPLAEILCSGVARMQTTRFGTELEKFVLKLLKRKLPCTTTSYDSG